MPLDYYLDSSLFRVKVKTGEFWVSDPDIANPAIEIPDTLMSSDPTMRLAWRMDGRRTSKVKIKVTFRNDEGVEVAGSYQAYAFVVVPLHEAEANLGATRPSIEKQTPGSVSGTSVVPQVIDELGINDVFGLVYHNIIAEQATHMFIRIEEVG